MPAPLESLESRKRWSLLTGILVSAGLWFAPLPLPSQARHAVAIVALMIILWITHAIPHAVTGLIGCYLFWTLGVAPFSTAFGGFASPTPWFLFMALLLGRVASKSGLANRLASGILGRSGARYPRILLSFILISFVLSLVIPSGLARVAVLSTIAVGLMAAFQAGPGSNVGRGLFLVLTYLTLLWEKMMLSGAGAILARGLIEKASGRPIYWSHWFLAFLPADFLVIVLCWRMTLWLYPPENEVLAGGPDLLRKELDNLGPWTATEKRAALLLLLLVSLWATDFLHHLSPEVIGIGLGLAAFLPGIRALTTEDLKQFNITPVLFTGAALSLSQVLVETKATVGLTRVLFAWMEPSLTSVVGATTALYWSGFGYHLFLPSAQSMLATTLPVLLQFTSDHGLNPLAVGLIWSLSSAPAILLYQSSVIILGYSYGYFEAKDFFKFGLFVAIMEFTLLLLLVTLLWPFIGLALRSS
jgi:sodium-dependent dicarboxylate transporter 2/3/5